jgi:hypothetical protein
VFGSHRCSLLALLKAIAGLRRTPGYIQFSEVLGTFFLVLVAAGGAVVNARSRGQVPLDAQVVAPGLMVSRHLLHERPQENHVVGIPKQIVEDLPRCLQELVVSDGVIDPAKHPHS